MSGNSAPGIGSAFGTVGLCRNAAVVQLGKPGSEAIAHGQGPLSAQRDPAYSVTVARNARETASLSVRRAEVVGDVSVSAAERDRIYRRSLAVADGLAAGAASLALVAAMGRGYDSLAVIAATLAAAPLIVIIAKAIGIYDRQQSLVRKSTLDEAPSLFQTAALYALLFWLYDGLVLTGTTDRRGLLALWIGLFALLLAFRAAARWFSRLVTPPERCLVIGGGLMCERMRVKLESSRSLHARVVASIRIDGLAGQRRRMTALSRGEDLRALIAEYRIDRIIVAPVRADAEEVLNAIRAATSIGVKVSVVPRILEVVGSAAEFEDVQGVPVLSMRRPQLTWSSQLMKRALDLTVSVFGLVIAAPVLAAIGITIKVDSRGPALFRQSRVGRDGKPFEMLKFRTMALGAHEQRSELQHLNQSDGLFKIENDPRVTRVGRFLRGTSLDELPQLWNVMRGDMSLVGPRPLLVEEDSQIQGWDRRRLKLTPGMTGHWQILGSARIPLDEMVKIDYLYVTNWSLWLDIKILLRTIPFVAARRGM